MNSAAEVREDRLNNGCCPNCNTRLFKVTSTSTVSNLLCRGSDATVATSNYNKMKIPLTIAGVVERGQCLKCVYSAIGSEKVEEEKDDDDDDTLDVLEQLVAKSSAQQHQQKNDGEENEEVWANALAKYNDGNNSKNNDGPDVLGKSELALPTPAENHSFKEEASKKTKTTTTTADNTSSKLSDYDIHIHIGGGDRDLTKQSSETSIKLKKSKNNEDGEDSNNEEDDDEESEDEESSSSSSSSSSGNEESSSSDDNEDEDSTYYEDYDPATFAELPEDIQQELLANLSENKKRKLFISIYEGIPDEDKKKKELLAQLPKEVQEELLADLPEDKKGTDTAVDASSRPTISGGGTAMSCMYDGEHDSSGKRHGDGN